MTGWLATPVITGLAVGIAFVLLFSFLLSILANQQHGRLVFSGLMNGTDAHQIYIVNDDGTGLTRLTEDGSLWHFEPVSSPDGSKITYVTHNSFPNAPPGGKLVQNLYVMNADGTNKVRVADSSDGFIGRHVWSPDGTKIAYEASEDILVVNVDDTNRIQITNDNGQAIDLKPVWLSDSRITFASLLRNGTDVLAASLNEINIDGTDLRTLFDYDYDVDVDHIWSPDLSKISFIHVNDDESSASLYIMNADGSHRTKLADSNDSFPLSFGNRKWSPDSQKIAFEHWAGDYQDIYVIDIDDGSYRKLSNSNAFDGNPVWSSDGQKIAFTRISEGEVGFYVMNANDGSGQMQIAKMNASILNIPLDRINSASK